MALRSSRNSSASPSRPNNSNHTAAAPASFLRLPAARVRACSVYRGGVLLRLAGQLLVVALAGIFVMRRRWLAETVHERYPDRVGRDMRRWSEFVAIVVGTGIVVGTLYSILV